jgi:hypothetical protein
MGWIWIVVAVAIALLFWWGNQNTKQSHARFTEIDVEFALREVISSDSRDHDAWDLFLTWPIHDPFLESIRQRCVAICRDYPQVPGHDLSEEAKAEVRILLAELRSRN